nr:cardiolipin synthase [Comamonas sp.]
DVCLLVPEKSDSKIVTAAARSYFDELISCGVKVFEYHARMLHSKTMVVDDMVGIIGTANFDNRSFRLNYEVCAVVYGESFAAKLDQQFQEDLTHARRVGYARPQSFLQRLGDSLARLFSPLL